MRASKLQIQFHPRIGSNRLIFLIESFCSSTQPIGEDSRWQLRLQLWNHNLSLRIGKHYWVEQIAVLSVISVICKTYIFKFTGKLRSFGCIKISLLMACFHDGSSIGIIHTEDQPSTGDQRSLDSNGHWPVLWTLWVGLLLLRGSEFCLESEVISLGEVLITPRSLNNYEHSLREESGLLNLNKFFDEPMPC